jgi:hypothetical protein
MTVCLISWGVTLYLRSIAVICCGTLCVFAQPPAASPTINLLAKTYRLGSFNQKTQAMWEFVSAGETVANWTTLLTLIDRPDAHTKQDLDRLAEGIKSNYESHGGKTLKAQTMSDASGAAYNYMVVAFEEPAKRRFELNFVKAALSPKNAYVAVYGVRITDPKDYLGKAKAFLNEHSGEVGRALENASFPDLSRLPRKEF